MISSTRDLQEETNMRLFYCECFHRMVFVRKALIYDKFSVLVLATSVCVCVYTHAHISSNSGNSGQCLETNFIPKNISVNSIYYFIWL